MAQASICLLCGDSMLEASRMVCVQVFGLVSDDGVGARNTNPSRVFSSSRTLLIYLRRILTLISACPSKLLRASHSYIWPLAYRWRHCPYRSPCDEGAGSARSRTAWTWNYSPTPDTRNIPASNLATVMEFGMTVLFSLTGYHMCHANKHGIWNGFRGGIPSRPTFASRNTHFSPSSSSMAFYTAFPFSVYWHDEQRVQKGVFAPCSFSSFP